MNNPGEVVTAYIVVYTGMCGNYGVGFSTGCGIFAKIINIATKIVIFKLKIIDLGAKFG